jgi:hypothetical protein
VVVEVLCEAVHRYDSVPVCVCVCVCVCMRVCVCVCVCVCVFVPTMVSVYIAGKYGGAIEGEQVRCTTATNAHVALVGRMCHICAREASDRNKVQCSQSRVVVCKWWWSHTVGHMAQQTAHNNVAVCKWW